MRLDSLVAVLGVWNPLEKLTSQLNLTEVVKDAAASMFATAAQLIIGMSLTVLEKVFLYIDSTTDFNIGTSTDTGAPTALARILPYTLWLGLTVAVIMAFWTLMSAGMRRDARQLGQLHRNQANGAQSGTNLSRPREEVEVEQVSRQVGGQRVKVGELLAGPVPLPVHEAGQRSVRQN